MKKREKEKFVGIDYEETCKNPNCRAVAYVASEETYAIVGGSDFKLNKYKCSKCGETFWERFWD